MAALPAVLTAGALALGACTAYPNNGAASGWLPSGTSGQVTSETSRVTDLWVGTWIAAWAVGILVWGLLIYSMVRYRRRKDDTGLPPQLRYNVPIEILYTVVPVFMVAVLFYYTARDEAVLTDTSAKPDVTINVVGKQWSWDFNYVDSNTYVAGEQTRLNPQTGEAMNAQPILYLPVNKRVEFVLTSRDVIHSFWVPAFLTKLDVMPGKVNKLQITPTEIGQFQGKCAELCGAYHSEMLFTVKVLSQSDYDAAMAALKAKGNTGQLPNTLSREPLVSEDQQLLPQGGSK